MLVLSKNELHFHFLYFFQKTRINILNHFTSSFKFFYIYARKQDKVKKKIYFFFCSSIAAFKSKMLEKANYCHEMNNFLGGLKKLFCKLTSIIIN